MRIVSVHLKNVKSHRDKELSFSRGINVLSGANGSGKSTIFEAIGYALFGVNAQDFVSRADRFLTIGEKRGEIGVVFEPRDGETWRVTRTVGAAGKWLLAREQGGVFEVEEHANAQETEQRIASLLGLSGNRPLAEQFKLVIGPFQNDFLGPFVIKQPTRRQEAFDEILGIDAWRRTFDGTKSLNAAIQAKMVTLQAELAGKMEQVAVLPGKEEELRGLRDEMAAKEGELKLRQAELERTAAQLAALEDRKKGIESVQSELRTLEERIRSGKDHVATQQLLAEQSRVAAAVVAAASEGKKRYDAAEERLKLLREQEKEKLLSEKRLAELDKEQSGTRTALEIETRELGEQRLSLEAEESRLAEEARTLLGEQSQVEKQESEAAASLERVKAFVLLFRELPVHRIENVLPYLFVTLDRIALIEQDAAEKARLLEGHDALESEAGELSSRQRELERIQEKRSELSGRRISLVEGREKIGAGDCPYFHEPCKNLEAGGGVELFTSRIEALEQEIAGLDAQAAALADRVASAQGAAQEFARVEQVRLDLQKGAREREELEQEMRKRLAEIDPARLVAAVTEWLEVAGLARGRELKDLDLALTGGPAERREQLSDWSERWRGVVVALEETLGARMKDAEAPVHAAAVSNAELKARRQAHEARKREATADAGKIQQREKAIESQRRRLESVLEACAAQKGALLPFAGVDDAIRGACEELERFQPDRDRFMENLKAAQELEKRLETLSKYQARLQELEGELATKREEGRSLSEGYQPGEHESAKAERERLVSLQATLKAEAVKFSEGIARLEGEIAALAAVAREIDAKLAALDELKEQAELVKFLRNQVFRNVSSQLSERFREEISSRADRIYRCISDADEELFWGDNYQIVLKDMAQGGMRQRTDDQLSGGQMMSAVVALRLALLQTIGARIAFFDEPTSNLDVERRENLAKAFRAIDVGQEEVTEHWYDQLFLVSHDVSFTEITDQMIHLD